MSDVGTIELRLGHIVPPERAVAAVVTVADLDGDKAKATAAEIEEATGNACLGMAGNVTKSEDIAAVVAATVKAFGGISTLVNNVGWGGAPR